MKLYVGNLNYSTREEDLQTLFAEFGAVTSVAIITDRATGRSKGFGFVEMESAEAAQAAIAKLNNFEYQGRRLTVNEARPKEDRPQGSGGGFSRGGGGGGYGRSGGSSSGGGFNRGERSGGFGGNRRDDNRRY
jgi:RNA recognition motif-containing protein